MAHEIRCPRCKGLKRIPLLGGMVGDCPQCEGIGKVVAEEVIQPAIVAEPEPSAEVIKEVQKAVDNVKQPVLIDEPVKMDKKRAIYKRKKVNG